MSFNKELWLLVDTVKYTNSERSAEVIHVLKCVGEEDMQTQAKGALTYLESYTAGNWFTQYVAPRNGRRVPLLPLRPSTRHLR